MTKIYIRLTKSNYVIKCIKGQKMKKVRKTTNGNTAKLVSITAIPIIIAVLLILSNNFQIEAQQQDFPDELNPGKQRQELDNQIMPDPEARRKRAEEEYKVSRSNFTAKYSSGYIPFEVEQGEYLSAVSNRFLGKGLELRFHDIEAGDHFWELKSKAGVNVDTVIGCNPYIKRLAPRIGDIRITINKRGTLHYVINEGIEFPEILAEFYNVNVSNIVTNNVGLSYKTPIKKGSVVFIPGAKPKQHTKEMYESFIKRKLFVMPTSGWTKGRVFGYYIHPILGVKKFHSGVDMSADKGTLVFAADKGKVTYAGDAGAYGNLIIIRHKNGYSTRYAHLSKIGVYAGEKVKRREYIGKVGSTGRSTGPHLHFEIRINKEPVDPMKYLW